MRKPAQRAIAVAAVLAITLAFTVACSDYGNPSRPGVPRIHLIQEVSGGADLITFSDDCPATVRVHFLTGHGACDTLLTPVITRDGTTVTITQNVSTADVICSAQLVGTFVDVSLGSDLAPGEYRLRIPSESSRFIDITFRVPECTP